MAYSSSSSFSSSSSSYSSQVHGWDGTNNNINSDCVVLAHRLLHAARVMFDTAGDTSNAAMVRCNLSSLLRMRSNWEMNCYRSKAKIHTPSTSISSTSMVPNADGISSKISDNIAVTNSSVTGDKSTSDKSSSLSSSSNSSDDAFAKYRESYRIALSHLKHAQRQCDYAVLALGTHRPPFLLNFFTSPYPITGSYYCTKLY